MKNIFSICISLFILFWRNLCCTLIRITISDPHGKKNKQYSCRTILLSSDYSFISAKSYCDGRVETCSPRVNRSTGLTEPLSLF